MSEAAVQVPETNIIVLFPQKTERGDEPHIQNRPSPEPEEITTPEDQSKYAKVWTCVADGIHRYNPSGTLFYRPMNADGGRTHRSLKTKNIKIAVERYQKLKVNQGNVAESKLKVGEITAKYEEDGYPGEDLEDRREETKADEKRHCQKLKQFWTNIRFADICETTWPTARSARDPTICGPGS